MDKDAHASLKEVGTSIGQVDKFITLKKTFDTKELENHVARLSQQYKAAGHTPAAGKTTPIIWYVLDGMVSTTGQIPNVKALWAIQRKFPNFWIFCDDAHGSGWSGPGGKGYIPDMIIREANTNANGYANEAERWIMSVCFNKGFGADCGALILPTREMKELVETMSPFCSYTCAKLPIPDLALIQEAMHMSMDGTIDQLQQELSLKTTHLHMMARELLGELVDFPEGWPITPILFVPIKKDTETFNRIVKALHNEGILVSMVIPPAADSYGVRLTVNVNTKEDDVDKVLMKLRDLLMKY